MSPTTDQLLRNADWLRRLARSLVLDDSEADDVVQEAWIAALSVERPPRDLRAWLAGVVRNLVRARNRGAARRKAREVDVARPESIDGAAVVERERSLLNLVDTLPEAQRDAIVARYFHGLAPREIASRTGEPVGTIKTRLNRGLKTLRSQLDQEHGDRRAWGLWLLPFAGNRGRGALPALVPALLAVAALAVAATAVALWPAGPTPEAVTQGAAAIEAPDDDPMVGATEVSPQERIQVPSSSGPVLRVLIDGQPAVGAEAWVLTAFDLFGWPDAQVQFEAVDPFVVGEDGLVPLEGNGSWYVRVSRDEWLGVVEVEKGTTETLLVLEPAPRLRLRVADEQGDSVPHVPIELVVADAEAAENPGWSGGDYFALTRPTVADGTVFFHGAERGFVDAEVPLHPATVAIDAPGMKQRVHVPYGVDHDGTVHLPMAPTAPLELHVLDEDGERIEEDGKAWVRGADRNWGFETPVENGVARWPFVALAEQFEVRVLLPGRGAEVTGKRAGPTDPGIREVIELAVPSKGSIRASLVNGDGKPYSGVIVDIHVLREAPRQGKQMRLEMGAEGEIRIALEPEWGGRNAVVAVFDWFGRAGHVRLTLPEVAPGTVQDLGDLTVVLEKRAELRGTCVDEQGQPISGIHVSAPTPFGHHMAAETREDGKFSLTGPLDLDHPVEFEDWEERFQAKELLVEDLSEELTVVLSIGGSLEGRVLTPEGFDPKRLTIRLGEDLWGHVELDGSFTVDLAPDEPQPLTVCLGGRQAIWGPETVNPGEPVDIDLRAGWRSVRFEVTNPHDGYGCSASLTLHGDLVALEHSPGTIWLREGLDVLVTVGGGPHRRSLVYRADELGEELVVELPQPTLVALRPTGDAEAGEYGLTPTYLSHAQKMPALRAGEIVTVPLRYTGELRLVRMDEGRAGRMRFASRQPLDFVIDVPSDPTSAVFELDLDAPPLEEE